MAGGEDRDCSQRGSLSITGSMQAETPLLVCSFFPSTVSLHPSPAPPQSCTQESPFSDLSLSSGPTPGGCGESQVGLCSLGCHLTQQCSSYWGEGQRNVSAAAHGSCPCRHLCANSEPFSGAKVIVAQRKAARQVHGTQVPDPSAPSQPCATCSGGWTVGSLSHPPWSENLP